MARPAKQLNNFKPGDPCKAKTNSGQEIIGNYVQAGPTGYAFVKGVISTHGLVSPFVPTQIFKVKRETIKKQA